MIKLNYPWVIHYLQEFFRVLKPGGLVYANLFQYSDEIINSARLTKRSHNNLLFEHRYAGGCFINDANYPTGAVAYTDEKFQEMISLSGLMLLRPYLPGWFSGFFDPAVDGQELAILRKA